LNCQNRQPISFSLDAEEACRLIISGGSALSDAGVMSFALA
jgi:hypothetical protein